MLMGATTYRLMAEIVATGDDPTFPRMAELPKLLDYRVADRAAA
jgi:hypothetical protein